VAPLVSFLLVLLYHLCLIVEVYTHPTWSVFGVNMQLRQRWVAKVMSVQGKEILGVQTLRNINMSAAVLASSTLVIALPFFSDFLDDRDPACVGVNDQEYNDTRIKIIVMCVIYLSAFFNFVLVVRIVTHASFLVGSQVFPDEELVAPHLSAVTPVCVLLRFPCSMHAAHYTLKRSAHTHTQYTLKVHYAYTYTYTHIPTHSLIHSLTHSLTLQTSALFLTGVLSLLYTHTHSLSLSCTLLHSPSSVVQKQ
jgi:Protein of unknown function, DUF599